MFTSVRLKSQQLTDPLFEHPVDVVNWMGVIQAQQYEMAKWAIGSRLQNGTLKIVEESINKGDIIRTHVLRPTWHFAPAKDLRWMLKLSGTRVVAACKSYAQSLKMPADIFPKGYKIIEKALEGDNFLYKQELGDVMVKAGLIKDNSHISVFLSCMEAEAIICSGPDKNKKPTFALLEERIPAVPEISVEEALVKLAVRYFQSHSPATLQDFVWWSGLTITEAKKAISLAGSELISDKYPDGDFWVHQSWKEEISCDPVFHFLPSYDEYLISYKD